MISEFIGYFDVPFIEYVPVEEVVVTNGYTTTLRSNGTGPGNFELVQLPYKDTTTATKERLVVHYDILSTYVIVIVGFFAVLKFLSNLIFYRRY